MCSDWLWDDGTNGYTYTLLYTFHILYPLLLLYVYVILLVLVCLWVGVKFQVWRLRHEEEDDEVSCRNAMFTWACMCILLWWSNIWLPFLFVYHLSFSLFLSLLLLVVIPLSSPTWPFIFDGICIPFCLLSSLLY